MYFVKLILFVLLLLLGLVGRVTIRVGVSGSRCSQWVFKCVVSVEWPQKDLRHVVMSTGSCGSDDPVCVRRQEDWWDWEGLSRID